MKRLKTILDSKHFKVLFLFIFLFILFKERLFFTSLFTLSFLYFYITKSKSVILLILSYLLISIPIYNSSYPTINKARVIEIKEKYIFLQNFNTKVIAYSEEQFNYDSIIEFEGSFNEIEESYGFYRYSFKDNFNNKGIYYSINLDNYKVIKQYPSLRYFLQKYINTKDNKELLSIFLLNISNSDTSNFINLYGFSYYAIIVLIKKLLTYICKEDNRDKYIKVIYIFLMILYHIPFSLIYHFLLDLKDDKNYKWLIRCIFLIIYKEICLTPLFIIPIFYSLLNLHEDHYKRLFFQSILSSLLFNSINLLIIIFYTPILYLRGLSWFYSLFVLIFDGGYNILLFIYTNIEVIYNLLNLKGSILGFGLILFSILFSLVNRFKYKYLFSFLLLLLFQLFGLFHPLAEVTFINVGQGDSILIREPFNMNNILIDTGKASQFNNLKSYLDAKSINKIHTLFISHHDSDHDGSMNEIIDEYKVNEYIDKHFKNKSINRFTFYDLNRINNEDKNESSLVLYTEINKLKYLFMGDASIYTEKSIINNYPKLDIDILKLSHHGSKTGTSDQFLDVIKPLIGIISSGKYSIYKHPSIEVINKLNKRHIPYLDTKQVGDISIFFIGKLNILVTSNYYITILK